MKLLLSLITGFQLLNPQIQEIPKTQENQINKDSERKKIEYKIRKDYGLDTLKLNFEIFSEDELLPVWGTYSPWSDSLKINYYEILRSSKRNNFSPDSILAKTMRHELAHYRVDKIQEKLDLESKMENKYSRSLIEVYVGLLRLSEEDNGLHRIVFQNFVDKKCEDLTDIIFDKIVNEGIAKYYEDSNAKPVLKNWPTSIKDIKNREEYSMCVYDIGWNLMYPIISAYGDKGIEYVLKNMPKYSDFSDLDGYQKKILKELGEQK